MRNIILRSLFLLVIASSLALTAHARKTFMDCTIHFPIDGGFVLSGKITGLNDKYIYLAHTMTGVHKVDSCLLKQGEFRFEGKVSEPEMIFLHTKDRKLQKVLYAENVQMTVSGDARALDKIVISGSKTQDENAVLEDRVSAHRKNVIALYNKAEKAKAEGDTVLAKKILAEAETLYRSETDIRLQFIRENPNSVVSLQELLNWMNDRNYKEARDIYANMPAKTKAPGKAKEVAKRLESLAKVELGNPFIDFTQKNVDGKAVSLSSYKGQYVLVEFWASWCGPCRAENPNLRAAYLRYKDKGFNILGVSLDENEGRWKKALEKDNLPWTQVSDLKGWNNEAAVQYGIRAIPANFLIDPKGNIVMRDLRGEALNKALEKLFP